MKEFRYIINEKFINEFNFKQIRYVLTSWGTSSEGLGQLQTVFRPRVNPFNSIFAIKNDFKTILFAGSQKREKERINKLLISLICFKMIFLKNTTQLAKRNIFMKNGNEARVVAGDSNKRCRDARQR